MRKTIAQVASANSERMQQGKVVVESYGPDVLIKANEEHLFMVLNNLLLNSLDALAERPNPAITIDWEVVSGVARIRFHDNGSGIAESDLPRIFDTFFSTKPTTGTGLGLSIVKKIIEGYEGEIRASSAAGEGTTFTVRLPLWEEAAD